METTPITTIQVETKTRDRLIKNGRMKETYDDVINRALDNLEKESDQSLAQVLSSPVSLVERVERIQRLCMEGKMRGEALIQKIERSEQREIKESSQLGSSAVRYNSTAVRVVDDMLDELAKSSALRRLFKDKIQLINELLDSDEKQETT